MKLGLGEISKLLTAAATGKMPFENVQAMLPLLDAKILENVRNDHYIARAFAVIKRCASEMRDMTPAEMQYIETGEQNATAVSKPAA